MKDATLGGYLAEHERPPAFQARDGGSYTVEILAEQDAFGEADDWRAYLFFVRWRGQEAVGHVESDYLARAESEASARTEIERMTLHEVKELLDALVEG